MRLTRAIFRRLATLFGAAARWCWAMSLPVWAMTPEGWRYRGRLLKAVPVHWREVVKRDPCVYCGRPATTIDHITPKARGGENGWRNEAGACEPCNAAKASLGLLLFLRARHHAALAVPSKRLPSAAAAVRAGGLTRRQRLEAAVAEKNAQHVAQRTSPSRRQTRAFQSGGHR